MQKSGFLIMHHYAGFFANQVTFVCTYASIYVCMYNVCVYMSMHVPIYVYYNIMEKYYI